MVEPPFTAVRVPLPIKSPTALALHLLLSWIKPASRNQEAIAFPKLISLLGIPTECGQVTASRSLQRALRTLNEHLERLDYPHLPSRYSVRSRHNKLRFDA